MTTQRWTEDAIATMYRDQATIKSLASTVRDLLALHIAHHNEPLHAAARALLRSPDVATDAFPLTDEDRKHAPGDQGNAREDLAACAFWLGDQDESLSFGLRSAEDGLKLWRFFRLRPASLPEIADEEVDGHDVAGARVAALGYDPLAPATTQSQGTAR